MMKSIMRVVRSTGLFGGSLLIIGVTGSGVAEARHLSAANGNAVFAGERSCFSSNGGGRITNNCSGGQRLFEIPLTLDNIVRKHVTMRAFSSSSANNVGCQAYTLNKGGGQLTTGSFSYLSSFGALQDLELGYFTPTSGGQLSIACWVASQGVLVTANYEDIPR